MSGKFATSQENQSTSLFSIKSGFGTRSQPTLRSCNEDKYRNTYPDLSHILAAPKVDRLDSEPT